MQLFLSLLLATANAFEVPPLFTVNLDLAPRLRWNGALAAVLRTHSFEDGFLPIFEEHNRTLFDNVPTSAWPRLARSLEDHWPDHAEELKGIADEFSAAGHRVSFEYLAGWTWFHELAHSDVAAKSMETRECTALLARDSSGATLHVGNMDQSPTAVRNVTLRVRFVRGGKRVFDGVDWYWFTTGVSRAVRAGVASAQENWRSRAVPTPLENMLDDLAAGPTRATPQMFVFRQALLTEPPPPFPSLVASLTTLPLAAPFYVVLGGPNGEGVVMARNESASEGTSTLGARSKGPSWLVQTNYDRWLPDPATDPRRSVAERLLTQVSAQADADADDASLSVLDLFGVASAYPVHNPHTAYTAVLHPATGELRAYVRDALCPVDPTLAHVDARYCQ